MFNAGMRFKAALATGSITSIRRQKGNGLGFGAVERPWQPWQRWPSRQAIGFAEHDELTVHTVTGDSILQGQNWKQQNGEIRGEAFHAPREYAVMVAIETCVMAPRQKPRRRRQT
jgi:hypothetical protein